LPDPSAILSNREALDSLSQAHLLILASAGCVGASGKPPARVWFSQLEHARSMEIKTAAVGLGALPIDDPRERVRLQRLLHNCTDCISVRDEESKLAAIDYGMSPIRISNNGSPGLALSSEFTVTRDENRIGFVLSPRMPSRNDFSYNSSVNGAHGHSAKVLIEELLADSKLKMTLFHDDTEEAEESAHELVSAYSDRVKLQAADRPVDELRGIVATCDVVFSMSLQGLVLCASAGVPAVGVNTEPGAQYLLTALGLPDCAVVMEEAAGKMRELRSRSGPARDTIKQRMFALRRKEAQNGRMLELLVPRRDRRVEGDESPKPFRKEKRREKKYSQEPFAD
jgi:polysaccharide pyruvyl transferase WcaK-like protein